MHLGTDPNGQAVTLDPASLTRHAVCVGMTGSGKTGLCLALLENLALDGVPILAIDPKGDLANLALVFPELAPADFAPWTTSDPAATADAWRSGLAASGLGPTELTAFRDRVEVIIHTPGSDAGVPVDVLTSLTRCPEGLADDPEGLREYVTGAVGALLGLIGHRSDPLTDPASILLARVLGDAFADGRDMPLDVLLPTLVDPPFDRLGYFPLDEFFPREDRHALALRLDAVVASPAFSAWRSGEPLDVGAWLTPRDGKTPLRVLYLSHLDDAQRMFFVTLLLHAVVAWSRRQPGSQTLRALVYFDEVFGYLPPHPKDPPSKWPVLTLMKQARAVGVGVMLATQNPVDVDYKALSNAGTWFVGRLQTRQDRARVVEGLTSAHGGKEPEQLDDLVAQLPLRAFVVKQAGRATSTLRSRHVLAYLRGPLTRQEVARLPHRKAAAAVDPLAQLLWAPPTAPQGCEVRWLDPECPISPVAGAWPEGGVVFRAALYVRARVVFDEAGWRETSERSCWWADVAGGASGVEGVFDDAWLRASEPLEGRYPQLPPWLDTDDELLHQTQTWLTRAASQWTHPGPNGTHVGAERGDVEVVRVVLIWVPHPA